LYKLTGNLYCRRSCTAVVQLYCLYCSTRTRWRGRALVVDAYRHTLSMTAKAHCTLTTSNVQTLALTSALALTTTKSPPTKPYSTLEASYIRLVH